MATHLIGEAQSLQRLQLRYAVLYLGLLLFSAVMGVSGLYLWREAADERDRLATMSREALDMRGSLYRQMKEVFDHAFLGDIGAADEFKSYAQDIDQHFVLVYGQVKRAEELERVDALRAAYDRVRGYGETLLQSTPAMVQAEGASLDLALEQGGFRDFEQELDAFEALLLRDRVRVDRRLSWLQAAVPWLLALPLLLATLIFIVFRRYLRRAVAEPLADIMTATRIISHGRFGHRVPERGAAELVRLSGAINAMAADLAASREALLTAEKQATLSALVPVVAHNIRNPLASIRATAQVIDDDALPDDVREGLEGIIAAADRLDRWTYSLLSYLHPLQPQRVPVTVSTLLDTVSTLAADRIEARGIQLRRVGWEEGGSTELDPQLMEQALLGLLNNAIEASPPGAEIILRHACAGGEVSLSVRDYGSGMSSAPAPRGLKPVATTKLQGSGLGIPFAAKVCEVHGGRLEFIHHDRGIEAVMVLPMKDPHAVERRTA
ncbi:sensor histidine kinase [Methyloversatilis thermotolerans]|uniref:sensor histidine kinase n=1 Tax=Methyloversatilis thermotolerans TaxID=1346290 RepID=UPI000360CD9A|nr:HAMP domain-containing sensor histidine kinase [Methyloversatilis thermotolerans]